MKRTFLSALLVLVHELILKLERNTLVLYNAEATNKIGFSALPGDDRNYDGAFGNLGTYGYWWFYTADLSNNVCFMQYVNANVEYVSASFKTYGYSIRCIKD